MNSPINGVVLSRQRHSEGTVQAGDAVLTLGDLNNLEVEVDLGLYEIRMAPRDCHHNLGVRLSCLERSANIFAYPHEPIRHFKLALSFTP